MTELANTAKEVENKPAESITPGDGKPNAISEAASDAYSSKLHITDRKLNPCVTGPDGLIVCGPLAGYSLPAESNKAKESANKVTGATDLKGSLHKGP